MADLNIIDTARKAFEEKFVMLSQKRDRLNPLLIPDRRRPLPWRQKYYAAHGEFVIAYNAAETAIKAWHAVINRVSKALDSELQNAKKRKDQVAELSIMKQKLDLEGRRGAYNKQVKLLANFKPLLQSKLTAQEIKGLRG